MRIPLTPLGTSKPGTAEHHIPPLQCKLHSSPKLLLLKKKVPNIIIICQKNISRAKESVK
jgi:hypothetical protein